MRALRVLAPFVGGPGGPGGPAAAAGATGATTTGAPATRGPATGQRLPSPLQALRARSAATAAPPVVERCDMCAEPVPVDHRHVVDIEQRGLLCCCTACSRLFTEDGAGSGRYRSVPDRYLCLSPSVITAARWDRLGIPVGTAFFFRSSATGRTTCFYPSPAGATESLLGMDVWEELAAAEPALAGMAPDVEALLVTRTSAGFDAFLVPVDACYELVGLLRRYWKGLDGGEQVREQSERFFAGVSTRCAQASPGSGP